MTAGVYDQRMILVCAASVQGVANAQAKKVDTHGGEFTFTVALSPSGLPPATHYWCNWQMTSEERTALEGYLAGLKNQGLGWAYDAVEYTPEQVLDERGLQRLAPPV